MNVHFTQNFLCTEANKTSVFLLPILFSSIKLHYLKIGKTIGMFATISLYSCMSNGNIHQIIYTQLYSYQKRKLLKTEMYACRFHISLDKCRTSLSPFNLS